MTTLAVQDLHVTFGTGESHVTAVDHIHFAVERGEVYGLVGESGCGKSTALRCIAGLESRWSGTIRIDGEPVAHRRDRDAFKRVQMVFQDPYGSLHPRHTVNTMLLEPLRIHGLDGTDARIDKVLSEVGLGAAFRYRYPHQLSGGQRQRVAIARALILEPEVVLLDEPTSALDVSVQAEILNLLKDIRAREGLTYVLVSHDLAVVAHLCDRLGVMSHGRIVEELTGEALSRGRVDHGVTRELLDASRGYDRETARAALARAERETAEA